MKYQEYYNIASVRMLSFGLPQNALSFSSPVVLGRQNFQRLSNLLEKQSFLSRDKIAHNCIYVSQHLKQVVENEYKTKAVLTVGYLYFENQPVYKFTEADIGQWIEKGCGFPKVDFHVWLTLDSGEILDITWFCSYSVTHNIPAVFGIPVHGLADSLKGLQYFPMGLGSEFLSAIGAQISVIIDG